MLDYSMTVKLLTKQNLESLSLTGGCAGSSESTLVKMPHCWKSHVVAHLTFTIFSSRYGPGRLLTPILQLFKEVTSFRKTPVSQNTLNGKYWKWFHRQKQ